MQGMDEHSWCALHLWNFLEGHADKEIMCRIQTSTPGVPSMGYRQAILVCPVAAFYNKDDAQAKFSQGSLSMLHTASACLLGGGEM